MPKDGERADAESGRRIKRPVRRTKVQGLRKGFTVKLPASPEPIEIIVREGVDGGRLVDFVEGPEGTTIERERS